MEERFSAADKTRCVAVLTGNWPEPAETFIRREITLLREKLPSDYSILVIPIGKILPHIVDEIPGVEVLPLFGSGWRKWLQKLNPMRRDFLQKLHGKNIVHLHAHFLSYPARAGLALAEKLGVPLTVSCHAQDIFTAKVGKEIAVVARAKKLFCCSAFLADCVRKQYPDLGPEKFQVMRHGLRFGTEETLPSKEPGTLLAVGRFCEKKGFERLFQALPNLSHPATLTLITDRPAPANLPQNISWLPWIKDEECLAAHYRRAAVLVVPSVQAKNGDCDNIPNVLIEGMAAGCAIVASRIGGIQEAVEEGVSGLLVEPGSLEDLAATLNRLLADSSLQNRFGTAARKRARELFDLEKNSAPLLETILHSGENHVAKF